jgi:nucleoside-diphosphate-sugar epimerase
MNVLVTGAAGFLGNRVIKALLSNTGGGPPVSRIVAADITACRIADPRIDSRIGNIANPAFIRSIVEPGVDLVFHLAAVLSGQSEAEFDLGLQVNLDATRTLLEACRALGTAPRFVFSSTVAVYGADLPDLVPEDGVLRPLSSYGTAKAMTELLVREYSRRGFIDGIAVRLATVTVRPGKPNSALSSFVSGIIREPLGGIDAVCPVPLDQPLWVTSPDVVTRNLIHAARVQAAALAGNVTVNLPGLCVTPAQMLASLEHVAGSEARARVRCEIDPHVARIVATWPGALDDSRARRIGFTADGHVDEIVRQYMLETLIKEY